MKLPQAFEEKMCSLLGDEFEQYINCFENPRYYGLRVNTSKISVEEFQKICPFPIRPIPWISNGFYYDGEKEIPSKHPYYFAGLYYLQEPSAMTPASRLPIEPGDRVLDVCAAPGGKATELGAKLGGRGLLAANDLSSSRAKGLLKNLELFGIGNMLVLSEEPGALVSHFQEYFDKILIDAPCSGEGMFRKDRKMIKAWEEHGPEYFCKIQKGIILQAAQMLRPGGLMLYSTCTFDQRENEEVIQYLLERFPEFKILPMEPYQGFSSGISRSEELRDTVRIFPHKMQGEGHYLALLRKGAKGQAAQAAQTSLKTMGKGKSLPEPLEDFLGEITWELDPSRIQINKERVYYMPEGVPDLRGVRFLRTGLLMGELKKERFEPSQALAMCLKREEYSRSLNLSSQDERVFRYLKGETLDVEDLMEDPAQTPGRENKKGKKSGKAKKGKENNWYLVCVDGYPLGWGKLAGDTLKNKYLPGWRMC